MGGFLCSLICFGIPAVSFLCFLRRREGCLRSFLTGMLVFVVFQLLTRIPLLSSVFPMMDWFLIMSLTSPVLTVLFYAFTAGLFEEVGRYLGFLTLGKKHTAWSHGLAFGLGHGGVEAIWVGVQVFTAGGGQLNYLGAGLERLFTMGVHVGLTFVVLKGIREKKIRYLFLAVVLHTLLDFVIPLIGMKNSNVIFTEGLIFLCGCGAVLFAWKERRHYAISKVGI